MAPRRGELHRSGSNRRRPLGTSVVGRLLFGIIAIAMVVGGVAPVLGAGHPSDPGFSGSTRSSSDDPLAFVRTVSVGSGPDGIAYDSGKRELFVANGNSNNVSVIAEATGTVVATVSVGSGPWGLAYDSSLNEVFVADSGSNDVRVINDATNQVVATVNLGGGCIPLGLTYDSGTSEVFVTCWGSNSVSVIVDASDTLLTTISVGSSPVGVAYDPAMGEVFVANAGASSVSVISDASDTVVTTIPVDFGPIAVAYDPAMGEVFVANSGSGTVSVISDASSSVVATVTLPFNPRALAYGSRGVAVTYIDNSPFAFGHLDLIADSNDTIVASAGLYAGGHPDSVAYDPANGGWYVADSVLNVVIIVAPSYYALFPETGLPAGNLWEMWLNGTSAYGALANLYETGLTQMQAPAPNGTYTFTVLPPTGYSVSPASGTVAVAGAGTSRSIFFSLLYTVTFTETGLPSGTTWSVTFAGTSRSTNATSITFRATNGTLAFTVGAVSGYVANPASGSVAVNGVAASQAIAFAPPAAGVSVELILVAVVAIVIVAGLALVLGRRRRQAVPPSTGAPAIVPSAPATGPVAQPSAPTPVVSQPSPAPPPTGLCPACGLQNDSNAVFCNRCATRLR